MSEQIKNVIARSSLMILYEALQKHKEFWAGWIEMRTGPMADFFAPTSDEKMAAKALGDALLKLKDGFDILDEIAKEEMI